MDYIVRMKIMDALEGLCEELEGFGFTVDVFGVLMVEKISLFCVFHDHIDLVIVKEGIPKFDDVRMVQFGVQFDLSFHQFDLGLRRHVLEVDLHLH